jgi:type II secretory pathway pseudopilin PulG
VINLRRRRFSHRIGSEHFSDNAFTLLEVVLAIGLTSIVIGLVMTTVEVYLFRADAGRTETETAQLARTLLERMAQDLRAARFAPPAASRQSSSTTPTSTGAADPSAATSSTSAEADPDASDSGTEPASGDHSRPPGIVGTETELRIDRSASWHWQSRDEMQATHSTRRQAETEHVALTTGGPETIRYFLGDGDILDPELLAARGIDPSQERQVTGLYREIAATRATLVASTPSLAASSTAGPAAGDPLPESIPQLLAPEVVDLQLAYLLDDEWLDCWDSSEQGRLPQAVEIRLTLLKHPTQFDSAPGSSNHRLSPYGDARKPASEELVKYRRVVHLLDVMPLPATMAATASGPAATAATSGEK